MSEQSMRCRDCVLKHIAAAISYAKEILDGHGKGGTPDHRPDYLGELVNAEHHLELLSRDTMEKVSAMRTAAQMKGMTPSEEDIEALRALWVEVESLDDMTEHPEPVFEESPATDRYPGLSEMENVGVLLDDAWYKEENKDKLETFLRLASENMSHGVLVSREDVMRYDIKYLWVFPLGVFIANKADMRTPVTAGVSTGREPSFMMRLVHTEAMKAAMLNDAAATPAELVDRMPFNGLLREEAVMPVVDKKPCCSLKRRVLTEPFVKVTDNGWPYMRELWRTTKKN